MSLAELGRRAEALAADHAGHLLAAVSAQRHADLLDEARTLRLAGHALRRRHPDPAAAALLHAVIAVACLVISDRTDPIVDDASVADRARRFERARSLVSDALAARRGTDGATAGPVAPGPPAPECPSAEASTTERCWEGRLRRAAQWVATNLSEAQRCEVFDGQTPVLGVSHSGDPYMLIGCRSAQVRAGVTAPDDVRQTLFAAAGGGAAHRQELGAAIVAAVRARAADDIRRSRS